MNSILNKIIFLLLLIIIYACCSLKIIVKGNINRVNKDGVKMDWWVEPQECAGVLIVKYKNGMKEGLAKILYTSGGYATLHYSHDKKNGIMKNYNKEGVLCLEQVFRYDSIITQNILCSPFW